jgi:hypothetical protein
MWPSPSSRRPHILPVAEAPAASVSPPEIRQSLQVDGFVGAGEGNRTPDLRFTKSFRRPIEVQRCQRISADTRVLQGFRVFTRCECIASFLSLSRPQRALSTPSTSTLRCGKTLRETSRRRRRRQVFATCASRSAVVPRSALCSELPPSGGATDGRGVRAHPVPNRWLRASASQATPIPEYAVSPRPR